MAGLLDYFATPAGQGLLSGIAGYAATARRGTPVNNIGRGLASGVAGYQSANQELLDAPAKALERQMRDMQVKQLAQQLEQQKALQAWKSGLPQKMAGARDRVSAYTDADNPFGEDLGDLKSVQKGDPQALQDYLMQPDSPYFQKIMERQLFPEQEEGFTLKPGERRYKGASIIAEVPDAAKLDVGQDLREWLRVNGIDPATATPEQLKAGYTYVNQAKDNRAPRTTVTVGPTRVENITTQESEGSKVYGKGLGEMQVGIQKEGFTAPSRIANLDRMSQLLEGVDSGRLSGAGLEAARLAKSFGFDIDPKLGNKQAAEALAIEMALAMREPGTGPMTDKDFVNYLNAVPSLAKTAEGRKQITLTLKAKAKRDIVLAKMAREYAKKNRGVIDDGFLDIAADYMAKNPVIQMPQSDVWTIKKKGP